MQKTSDSDLNNNRPQPPPNPITPGSMEGSLSIPESHTLVETKKAWWARVRIDKIVLFMVSIYLFILAIMLLKDGARVLTPLIQDTFRITNAANSLGFGWLFAYIIMSGSPVAAASLAFFDSGVISKLGAFAMITGSRLGASFIVLLIGFLYVLRGRNRATSLSMGLLSLSITGSTYIPAFFLGIFFLQTGQLDRIQFNQGALLNSTTDLLVGPITDFISGVFPQWAVFFIGLGIIYFSFNLFDKCLPQMAIKESRVGWASRLVYRPVVMFLFGALITLISMSVSVSLSILVPLSNRGFIRRENVLPYIMGANITTFVDTLLAAVLLGNPPAFTIVFVEMLTITLVSMIILFFFYPRYQRMNLNFVAWVTEKNWNLAVFLFIIFLIPIILVLI